MGRKDSFVDLRKKSRSIQALHGLPFPCVLCGNDMCVCIGTAVW